MTLTWTSRHRRSQRANSGTAATLISTASRIRSKVSLRKSHDACACADRKPCASDDFPGHHEAIQQSQQRVDLAADFYIPEDPNVPHHTRLDKSNLLLIGPTGVGKTYILEYVLSWPSALLRQ